MRGSNKGFVTRGGFNQGHLWFVERFLISTSEALLVGGYILYSASMAEVEASHAREKNYMTHARALEKPSISQSTGSWFGNWLTVSTAPVRIEGWV